MDVQNVLSRNSALKYLPIIWDWNIDYFATTPRILDCLKHILQKRVADLNEILHWCNLLPREISSKSFKYF